MISRTGDISNLHVPQYLAQVLDAYSLLAESKQNFVPYSEQLAIRS